ncbi:hypothetical protein HHI36_004508 [Cryptolaemus montrouzieri]|uniref:LRRCT domain-containing protein n=1 Tax=Cryptolaemus montrouzieri TaxID=559131 RepID=A0ABD2NRK8_9CUCU
MDTFQDLTELRELNLGQNYLLDLPDGLFLHNTKLEKLILYSNSLVEFREKSLMGLENLTTLLINNNLLESIHPDAFLYAPNIEKLHLDSNKFRYLQPNTLDPLKNITSIKMTKNQWHCDCHILYLALWVSDNNNKLWDSQPSCRGPGELGGKLLKTMRFQHLCDGQWASMINLAPRVKVKHNELKIEDKDELQDKP